MSEDYMLDVARTPSEVIEERAENLKMLVEQQPKYFNKDTVFTCDYCALNNKCTLAFDGYNTEGSCLLDK